jgi:hypothetical protein
MDIITDLEKVCKQKIKKDKKDFWRRYLILKKEI